MSDLGPDPLLPGLAAGREEAFAALYDRYAQRLLWAAQAMLDRQEDAEDAVQEVFVALVRSRRKLGRARDLKAYLFTALRRAAGRVAQRRAREPIGSRPAEEVPAAEEQPADGPHGQRLKRALRALPPEQREVIALRIDGELSFTQIAEVTGVSANTAASRYRYALAKLRASLAASEQPTERPIANANSAEKE